MSAMITKTESTKWGRDSIPLYFMGIINPMSGSKTSGEQKGVLHCSPEGQGKVIIRHPYLHL